MEDDFSLDDERDLLSDKSNIFDGFEDMWIQIPKGKTTELFYYELISLEDKYNIQAVIDDFFIDFEVDIENQQMVPLGNIEHFLEHNLPGDKQLSEYMQYFLVSLLRDYYTYLETNTGKFYQYMTSICKKIEIELAEELMTSAKAKHNFFDRLSKSHKLSVDDTINILYNDDAIETIIRAVYDYYDSPEFSSLGISYFLRDELRKYFDTDPLDQEIVLWKVFVENNNYGHDR